MKCEQCAYYWQDSDDDFPQCHFECLDPAPCEIDHDDPDE